VEVHGATLAWAVRERGRELERRETRAADELLSWVFDAVTASMASAWELAHRRPGEDVRVRMYAKRMELVGLLSPAWCERWRSEYRGLLRDVGLEP
jgi:hypothetical protein